MYRSCPASVSMQLDNVSTHLGYGMLMMAPAKQFWVLGTLAAVGKGGQVLDWGVSECKCGGVGSNMHALCTLAVQPGVYSGEVLLPLHFSNRSLQHNCKTCK